MGIAEYKHLGAGTDQLFQAFEIHLIALEKALLVINRDEWIVHHLKSAGLRYKSERVIYRRLNYNLVARREKTPLG